MHAFPCPHCAAPLRIRDRSLFARPLDCPDCGGPFRVEPEGRMGIRVLTAEIDEVATADASRAPDHRGRVVAVKKPSRQTAARPERAPEPAPRRAGMGAALARVWHAAVSPVGISWIAAGTAGLGLLFAIRPWSSEPPQRRAPAVPVEATEAAVAPAASTDRPIEAGAMRDEAHPLPPAPPELPNEPLAAVDEPAEVAAADEPIANAPAAPAVEPAPPEAKIPGDAPAEPAPEPVPEAPKPVIADQLEPIPPRALPQTIDVVRALAQPIRKFDQSQPVAAGDTLSLLEEMISVPIRRDPAELSAALDRRITLVLERTTAGEILDAIVEKAGLSYEIRADGIDLRPRLPGNGAAP